MKIWMNGDKIEILNINYTLLLKLFRESVNIEKLLK